MSWYFENGIDSDVVVSTRIRYARNISGINFGTKIDDKDEEKIVNKFKEKKIKDLTLYKLTDVDDITKMSLVEKHIMSRDILNNKNGAFLLSDDESVCVMLNEEDHIRIQVVGAGLDFKETFKKAQEIDSEISKNIDYSYSDKYGYLTTCPTNLGTGLRVSTMLHLPGLRITGRIQKVLDVINKINVTVRGVYGEGTVALGDMYQVSNKISLGVSEQDIISNVKSITETIIKKEREARDFLRKQGVTFEDKILREYGTLRYAKKITYDECARLISDAKLGVDMGIINDIDLKKVNMIRTLTKPASIQKYYKCNLEPNERDLKRAELIKEIVTK